MKQMTPDETWIDAARNINQAIMEFSKKYNVPCAFVCGDDNLGVATVLHGPGIVVRGLVSHLEYEVNKYADFREDNE